MKKIVLFLVCFSFGCSAREAVKSKKAEVVKEVIEKTDFVGSYSRKGYDILTKLYLAAQESDPELALLHEKTVKIGEQKGDSLRRFRDYEQINRSFFETADNYAANLNDSTLRFAAQKLLTEAKADYATKTARNMRADAHLEAQNTDLQNRQKLLKILVGLQMMQKYAADELPSPAGAESLFPAYDSLISETNKQIHRIK